MRRRSFYCPFPSFFRPAPLKGCWTGCHHLLHCFLSCCAPEGCLLRRCVTLAVKAYRIQSFIPNSNVKHHTGQTGRYHTSFHRYLFCTSQPLIQKESEKDFIKLLLLDQAVLRVLVCQKKKVAFRDFNSPLVQTIFNPVRDQGKRCHERPSGIVSRLNATLWHEAFDRSITPPRLCRPLKNRL